MTPIRQQYLHIKKQYPGAIVLFRLGDFYETFDEDAKLAARELEITLTSREMGKGKRVPMAGIPYHALDSYLARLVNRGHKVAICEQTGEVTRGKGLVERAVVRVVTPGTVVEPSLLEGKENSYLVSMVREGEEAGVAYVDITTGEFATTQMPSSRLAAELERLSPREVLIAEDSQLPPLSVSPACTPIDSYWMELETARRTLLEHFGVATLEGYGCGHLPLAIRAAGAIIQYLIETQKGSLGQITALSTYHTDSFMMLDPQTRRNLEIFESSRWGGREHSLLSVLDFTATAMGGRLLKKWLGQPLLDLEGLTQRQEAVAWLREKDVQHHRLASYLGEITDLERLVNRVGRGHVLPRELLALARGLRLIPEIKELLQGSETLAWLEARLRLCQGVVELVSQAIVDEPSSGPGEGGVIREGFSPEMDQLRSLSRDARQYLASLERREREKTGIKSLKVSYNRVFGYYIEVSKPHLGQVPPDYVRKQTLVGGERFITPELKEYESLILNAGEKMAELESQLFRQVCLQVAGEGENILGNAYALAELDVFCSLAEAAARHDYVRPTLTAGDEIDISAGRHPVVERYVEGNSFVPNDTYLSNGDAQIVILTGPNMAGKSTYLRQVALMVLMAQIGSFVPATSATMGLVDRIFTRIGAQEDLAAGQSTFMVEMVETANILNHATPGSLIILDEIGRGTSTYDGLSIARAVVEHIHNQPRLGSKTLFATHYHELVELAGLFPRVRNFNVAVMEEEGEVVFLHRIVPGGADKSYGIHVARLAGLPRPVLRRAQEVLSWLEDGHLTEAGKGSGTKRRGRGSGREVAQQVSFLTRPSPLVEEIAGLDVDSLTPLEAITKLYELRRKAKEEGTL